MVEWHFFDRVYRRWLCVMIGTPEDFKAEIEKQGYDEDINPSTAKGMCISLTPENTTTNQNCAIIWMPKWDMTTLVHELIHFVMLCLDDVGVPMERNNTEAVAFYMEFWYTEITTGRRRHPNGRSPAIARKR